MKKVLFITNIPSPYRIAFFNELSKYVNLSVLFERESASDRDEKWKNKQHFLFNAIFLNGFKFKNDLSISFRIKKYLNEGYDFIVFCNFSSPTGIIGIRYCQRKHIPYYVEGDGAFYNKNRIKDSLKRKLFKKAVLAFSTCNNLDLYFKKLGIGKQKICRYHFSSITQAELIDRRRLKKVDNQKKTILYVGQFIYRKGLDILLKACKDLSSEYRLVLIGGQLDGELSFLIKDLKCDLVIQPFKTKEELDIYFKTANVFVLPTREDIWGLVVNEALSYGVPVITTTACNAGLELIKNGYNGFVIEPNNSCELGIAINNILKIDLKRNCYDSIKNYSIEQMAADHMKVFNNEW